MNEPNRRVALVVALATFAPFTVGCGGTQEAVGAPPPSVEPAEQKVERPAREVMTRESQHAMTPEQALSRLRVGNERFVSGRLTCVDPRPSVRETAPGQYPFAAVLGCIDSRVPVEMVFDQGIGDLFVGRVAGNVVEEQMLGSLEFATEVAGANLVVVLGHTSCGAVMGACDQVDVGHVTALVEEIQPSVQAVTPEGRVCSSSNLELVNDIAAHNVGRTIAEMRQRSEILRNLEAAGTIRIVGAMYDVGTGRVTFMEDAGPVVAVSGRAVGSRP